MSSPEYYLPAENVTRTELERREYDFLEKRKYNPVAQSRINIDYSAVKKNIIIESLYKPASWSRMAIALAGFTEDNFTILDAAPHFFPALRVQPPPSSLTPDAT